MWSTIDAKTANLLEKGLDMTPYYMIQMTSSKNNKNPKNTATKKAAAAAAPKAAAPKAAAAAPKAAAAPAVDAPPAAPAVVVAPNLIAFDTQFDEIIGRQSKWVAEGVAIKNEMVALKKAVAKDLKPVNKDRTKAAQKDAKPPRAPSGFMRLNPISKDLAEFLGKPAGTMMKYPAASSEIHAYCDKNGLKGSSGTTKGGARIVTCDAKLAKLLGLKENESFDYMEKGSAYNLQTLLAKHFTPEDTTASAASTAGA
jgi:chromatin remodeling complex protein RSC6